MAVTSLAVSRLRVAFWGNPSHKAGARGAVLVSMHGSLEGRPAGHVCFLRHGLTPVLRHCRESHQGMWIPRFPRAALAGQGTGSAISIRPYLCRSEVRTPLPAQQCHKGCRCWLRPVPEPAGAPAFWLRPQERGGFCFQAPGKWQHVVLPQCQPGCRRRELCAVPGWSPSLETSAEGQEEESLHGPHYRRQKCFVCFFSQSSYRRLSRARPAQVRF